MTKKLKVKAMDVLTSLTVLFNDFYIEIADRERTIEQFRSELNKCFEQIAELESKIKVKSEDTNDRR